MASSHPKQRAHTSEGRKDREQSSGSDRRTRPQPGAFGLTGRLESHQPSLAEASENTGTRPQEGM